MMLPKRADVKHCSAGVLAARPERGAPLLSGDDGLWREDGPRKKARLDALVDPAITRLGQLVAQTENPSTALSAVNSVLNRAGFVAPEAPASPPVQKPRLILLIQPEPGTGEAPVQRVLSPMRDEQDRPITMTPVYKPETR